MVFTVQINGYKNIYFSQPPVWLFTVVISFSSDEERLVIDGDESGGEKPPKRVKLAESEHKKKQPGNWFHDIHKLFFS